MLNNFINNISENVDNEEKEYEMPEWEDFTEEENAPFNEQFFDDRQVEEPLLHNIKVKSQNANELLADIEFAGNIQNEGTPINAEVMNNLQSEIKKYSEKADKAQRNAKTAYDVVKQLGTQVTNKLGTVVTTNGKAEDYFETTTKLNSNLGLENAKKLLVTDDGGNVISKIIADSIYPVGSIYMSINNVDPKILFGGEWKQLDQDAYLKIVTSNAGVTGGTTPNHTIPVSCMPSHNHTFTGTQSSTSTDGKHNHYTTLYYSGSNGTPGTYGSRSSNPSNFNTSEAGEHSHTFTPSGTISSTGNGNAYYPYYYGIYAWVRTN